MAKLVTKLRLTPLPNTPHGIGFILSKFSKDLID